MWDGRRNSSAACRIRHIDRQYCSERLARRLNLFPEIRLSRIPETAPGLCGALFGVMASPDLAQHLADGGFVFEFFLPIAVDGAGGRGRGLSLLDLYVGFGW